MLSTTFRALSLFSILASTALAGEICTFAGTNCEGLFGCCTSLAEGTCCAWRTGTSLGWSVQVGKVESEAWVTTLSRDLNCSGQHGLGQGESDGSVCVSVEEGTTNFNSGKWVSATLQGRSEEAHHAETGACATPDVIGYSTPNGIQHLIKVPEGEGQLEYITQLAEAQDFDALSRYAHYA